MKKYCFILTILILFVGPLNVAIQANQAPEEITAINPADGLINQPINSTLSWNVNYPEEEGSRYNVYWVNSDLFDIFNTINLKSFNQTSKTYTFTNLPYNTKIFWGIEAINGNGNRKYSSTFNFTTIEDSSVPAGCSILINSGAASTDSYSVTLNLSAVDSDSGVKEMKLSNDGNNWTNWINYTTEYQWNLADWNYGGQYGLAAYTVYAKFKDYEGNASQSCSDSITKTSGTSGQILLKGKVYPAIQDAIDAASQGDTVYLTEGYYSVPVSLHSELPDYFNFWLGIVIRTGITLKGEGADKTVIDIQGNARFGILDSDNSTIEGLTIISYGSVNNSSVILLESDLSKIKNCIIKGGENGIYIGNYTSAFNTEISNNLIINNNNAGIWLALGNNVSIYNNTIANNNSYGFYGCLGSAKMVNNIITKNGIDVNDVYDNNNDNYNGNTSDSSSFVDFSAGDYHLNSNSPCINAGANVGIPYTGSAPDMGAYEYNGTGEIQVLSNRTDASFTIRGSAGSYDGAGTSWSASGLPIGIYTITFKPITNCCSPSYQTEMLYSGQILTFDGNYQPDTIGPTGTMSINFDEYATADKFVTITFDITDEIAGIGSNSQMMFSNDGAVWSSAEPYLSIKKNWDLTGTKIVYAKVSDSLGNWATLTDSVLYVPNRQVLEVPTQYSTIQSAIDAAQDGDMVYVLPGTYEAAINLKQGVRLQGAGASMVILQNWTIKMASNSMIDGFTVQSSLNCYGCDFAVISNNVLKGTVLAGLNGKQIVRNNLVKANICILGWNASKGEVIIANNTLNNVNRTALTYEVTNFLADIKVYLKNNIIAFNNIGVIDTSPDKIHQHIFPSFNTYWGNIKGNFGELDQYYSGANNFKKMGPGDINSDPKFVDFANDNFHLHAGSASINSGEFETRFNDPDGTRNDRGVYGGPALNTAPNADFSVNPLQGGIGTIFSFNAALSHDVGSKDEQLQVRWDFDCNGIYDSQFSSDKISTHKYSMAGVYNVKLEVKDEKGFISTSIKSVKVINHPPNAPNNPIPANNAKDQPVTIILRWDGDDPDVDDEVNYDVYFGTSSNPPLVSSGQGDKFLNLGTVNYGSVYYWKVVATDSNGASSINPTVWTFITGNPPEGSVSVNSGSTYTNSVSIIVNLSASDDVGVTGYYITTNSSKPLTGDSGWIFISSTKNFTGNVSYTLNNGDGIKTLYVWYEDEENNVSETYSDSIILDTEAPVNISSNFINKNVSSTNSTTTILSLSATDNINVAGYSIAENSIVPSVNDSSWIAIASTAFYSDNVSFLLSNGDGTKTVYVWFK
ncbi:MAG: NosD domain-containing protein, partial [bacterium]